ncbi:MAG: rod shape-determining protein MreC, partial [Nocardioidaceae bacterium]
MTRRGPDRRRARTVAALLVLTALSLLSVDQRLAGPSPLADLRSAVASTFGPMERGVAALASPRRWLDAGTDERTAALEAEVDRLRAQLRTSTLDRARAAELDELLGLTSAGRYASVPARVVAASLVQGSERTVTIDVGSSDGVAADMTVINGDGLVGRVLAATASTATVQLAIDPRA